MSATIIKLGSTLTTPNSIKVKTDILDHDQTLVLHDFSKKATYPDQLSIIALDTELVNLSTTNAMKTEGMVVGSGSQDYSAAQKCIIMQGPNGGGDRLFLGSRVAPYPLMPFSGIASDLLLLLWVKIVHTGGDTTGIIFKMASSAGSGNNNSQFVIAYGGSGVGKIDAYILGRALTVLDYTENTWMQVAVYGRCTGYNGKTGLIKIYKNGVMVGSSSASIPSTFFAADNTLTPTVGGEFGGLHGSLGRLAMLSGLDPAGLNPDDLVAKDYAIGSPIWTV